MSMKHAIKYALFLGLTGALLSGCGVDKGGDDNSGSKSGLVNGFPTGKTLLFYNTTTNAHYTYNSDTGKAVNLNSNSSGYEEFYLGSQVESKYFIWVDDKGNSNATDDEEKVLMLNGNYTYAEDGNATYGDFYYLAHFHEGNVLAAHDNDEFNVTTGAKYNAMVRLNKYLLAQEDVKSEIKSLLLSHSITSDLCGFYLPIEEVEEEKGHTHYHYAMTVDGKLHLLAEDSNETLTYSDVVNVADSCTVDKLGMTRSGDGLLLFLNTTQKLYLIDAHGDGVAHIHSSWNLSEFLGDGIDATIMSGLGEGEHDHDE